jgi:chromate transporter
MAKSAPPASPPPDPDAPPIDPPQSLAASRISPSSAPDSSASRPPIQPTLAELFIAFATISLSGFGGVLAWSRRMMVEERKWMTAEQFNEAYALCAFLPGPNIVNFSVVFGSRFRGAAGAIVALVGLIGPPMLLVSLIGLLYGQFGEIAALRRMLTGVAAAAAGLMMATAAKMALPLFRRRAVAAPLIALATFAAIGILRWPLPLVLGVLMPLSVGLAWVRR